MDEDLNGRINIRIYKGPRGIEIVRDKEPSRLVSIVGSLEIAKNMIMKNIQMQRIQGEDPRQKKSMIGKDEAMKIYMDLGNKIKDRILAIHKSNDNSQFDINPDLLSIV